jgi:peptidoglycan/xylan/chitin deacetylase (PgdA/CDA1 family)
MAGDASAPPARPSLRSRVLEAICGAVYFTGLLWLGLRIRRLLGGGLPRVLVYHRVAGDEAPGSLRPERFARHLRHLRSNYSLVAPSRIAELLIRGQPLPRDAVAVTFDDGYRDLLDGALPALRSEMVTAGFFVLSAHLPGRGALFLDRIRGTPLDAERKVLASTATADREARLAGLPNDGVPPLMDAEDLRRLLAEGQEVGSHGRTHGLLPALPPGEVRIEVAGSRDEIRRHAGIETTLFAYPWGAHGDESRRLVAEAGYAAAFATGGSGVGRAADRLAIPRIHVPGDASVARLACEAAGLVEGLRKLLR